MIRAIIAGALLFGSTLSTRLWPLSWLAAYLVFQMLLNQNFTVRIRRFGLSQIIYFGLLLHWTSIYVGSLPWITLTLLESVLMGVVCLFRYKRNTESALLFALLWSTADFLRMKFPFGGFGWGRIGFSHIDSPFRPLLAIGGVTLITFVVVFTSSLANVRTTSAKTSLLVVFLIIFASFIYQYSFDKQSNDNQSIKVAAVQGGVKLGLDFNRTPEEVFSLHLNETQKNSQSLSRSAFVLWPENSVDIDPFVHANLMQQLNSIVEKINSPLLVGAVLDDNGLRNASLFITSDSISRYYKRDLAPFGEYIPLRSLAQQLSPYAADVTDFRSGEKGALFSAGGAKVAPLICFEVLDDQFVSSATRSASFLAIQTNNATFGRSSEAIQQFLINRVRAYEMRKPAVIASTTGFSAVLNDKGEVVSSIEQFQPGVAIANIQPQSRDTFRAQFPYASEFFIFVLLAFVLLRRKLSL
jgi:apolipoprotein N-acyltransferase